MNAYRENILVKGILSSEVSHVLVAGKTSRFQCCARDIFLLPTHQVDAKSELIDQSLHRHRICGFQNPDQRQNIGIAGSGYALLFPAMMQ